MTGDTSAARRQVDELHRRHQQAWRQGERLFVETLVAEASPRLAENDVLELIYAEVRVRAELGETCHVGEYMERFPQFAAPLRMLFAVHQALEPSSAELDVTKVEAISPGVYNEKRAVPADDTLVPSQDDVHTKVVPVASHLPRQIGRYMVERLLGEGGFGRVYLARDDLLQRAVAIKVSRSERLIGPQEAQAWLQEARTVASLDHPNIVPIFDVGTTSDGLCYVVSKLIAGSDLAQKNCESRPSFVQAAELIATVAEALHYAHRQGFIHRDVKPANILIDTSDKPYLADFGLALKEADFGREKTWAGTPAYMSPEQARGEGHRVDGRSDIFSLGVVFYELLVGRRPFKGSSIQELLEQITAVEARPPRQIEDGIPRELERICLKALSKRTTERFLTAKDLADDLRHYLCTGPVDGKAAVRFPPAGGSTVTPPAGSAAPQSDAWQIKIVPKGLRSFDSHDADFFLELLPGPRDRDGLPDSLRFWKACLEETDLDNTFFVGVIYGPSGCGKSSLVKAGLLPRLSEAVIAVYLEATADETETRLLSGLRKRCPGLSDKMGLTETLTTLRRGQGIPAGKKVVIILDQFEQWLHARKAEQNSELVQALRQCDGQHVQCVVMVRDDFWMAATRFMRDLEVRLLEGRNSAAVDLFDPDHARKVLAAFGRAFGKLPEKTSEQTKDQQGFLNQAVSGLAQDGKVISVRLALFAEMMKGKAWTPATLKEVGGTEGVGVTFLEETFSVNSAPPEHRYHQDAARGVLRSLLPESGTDIKGHMQSRSALLEASGYAGRPQDFDGLIRILDSEIRLITPTDPEGNTGADEALKVRSEQKYFQLTHDYLVPSLREWLTRRQKETRRGRAELLLADRAAVWNARPENRQLPSLWQWIQIRWLTAQKSWTVPQRKMMAKGWRVHGLRSVFVLAGLLTLVFIGVVVRTQVAREQEATRIEGLVGRLLSAEPNQLPGIIQELDANPNGAATYLSPRLSAHATTVDERRAQLHARLATVARDPALVEPLVEELLTGKVAYVLPIRRQLRLFAAELTPKFRGLLRDEQLNPERRFRAALALADFISDSEAPLWTEPDLKFIAGQLVSSNAEFQPLLRDALRPLSARLLANLERIFEDPQASDGQRLGAANALADYAARDVVKLSRLLAVATGEQHAVLYPIVAASPAPSTVPDLSQIAATLPPADLGTIARVAFGQRRANAAVTLARLGERARVLPVFDMTDDPEALTQFIFRCRSRAVDVESLLDCLQLASATPVRFPRNSRYGLLLALGEFSLDEIPAARREALLKQLADWYRQDPSSGIHGAAGWLLRQWGQTEVARQVDQTSMPYAPDREWFTLAVRVTPTATPNPQEKPAKESAAVESVPAVKGDPKPPSPNKTFYYTFIVFPAGDYEIGAVSDEPDKGKVEVRHHVKLTCPFALLDRELTFEELIAYQPQYAAYMSQYDAKPTDAAMNTDWYDSVGFCRWLGQQSELPESDQSYAAPEALDQTEYPREPDPGANWAPRNWPLRLGQRGFRLPTESEWEVASRAGVQTTYGFGSDVALLNRFGWFLENSGRHVHPPRELRPSIRGLFDLHGNVFEWNHDWYGDYDLAATTDPLGANPSSSRVRRGGSWFGAAWGCRSANRYGYDPSYRVNSLGFRLALSPSEVNSQTEERKSCGASRAVPPAEVP